MDDKVVVDASVWVSRFIPLDVNHNASSRWIEHFTAEGGYLVVPTFLQIEVAASISRVTGDTALAKQIVKDMNSDEMMQIKLLNATLLRATVNLAADLQLRAGDAIYVAVAHQLHVPLVSWDKEQLQRAGSLITTYTPNSYIF